MKNILEQLYAGELVPAELKIEGTKNTRHFAEDP